MRDAQCPIPHSSCLHMEKAITKSEQETIKFGERLAKKFRGGEILCLEGELGTGKTTLIKGIAKGLGIRRNITSPTFVLMKLYPIKHPSIQASKHLCHIDAYRINDAQELVDIGALEYLASPTTVVVIEWAEKVKDILPKHCTWVKVKHGKSKDKRIIQVIFLFLAFFGYL